MVNLSLVDARCNLHTLVSERIQLGILLVGFRLPRIGLDIRRRPPHLPLLATTREDLYTPDPR